MQQFNLLVCTILRSPNGHSPVIVALLQRTGKLTAASRPAARAALSSGVNKLPATMPTSRAQPTYTSDTVKISACAFAS
jgi:hypothetical protein